MPNKVYINPETPRTWSDAGTTSDELMDLGGLVADGVVCGSFWDRGVAPFAEDFDVELFIDGFNTAPVVGETILLYFTESDGTTGFDGRPTTDPTDTAEGTVTTDQIKNLGVPAVIVSVVSTTAGDNLQARAKIKLTKRYVAPVVHNNTADALLSTSDAHMVTLTPIPPEIQ
ncbi:MAG: hypothetical protein ACE5EH_12955 [Gammaproteobacteria bacterium]